MTVHSLKWFDRFNGKKPAMSLPDAAQQALGGLGRLATAMFGSVPAMHAAADELSERAAAYEATQPGYAADLRAAAHQARSRHFGTL
jgi:hypothetical protein